MYDANAALKKNCYDLRDEVHRLAEGAFHQHLISGYGDSEYPDQFQIVYQGKPKQFPLQQAYMFLQRLVQRSQDSPHSRPE
jgi:hypothetical protein